MKKLFLLLIAATLILNGCARHYVITLNNGRQLGAKGKPQLKGGSYYFKDASGVETSVSSGRVSQIETESSAARGHKSGYIDGAKK